MLMPKEITTGAIVGRNLRALREEHGATQAEMAQHLKNSGLNWAQSKLSQVESGMVKNISINAVLMLTIIFDKPLTYWFQGSGLVVLADYGDHSRVSPTVYDADLIRSYFEWQGNK